jgi:hypothetical protein
MQVLEMLQVAGKKLANMWNNMNSLRTLVTGLTVISFTILLLSWASFLDSQRVKQAAETEVQSRATYSDEALGIKFSYPRAWNLTTQTKRDSTYEDPAIGAGKIPDLSEFIVNVSDGNTRLEFLQFFGPLKKSYRLVTDSSKYVKVGDRLMRYPSVDFKDWYYVELADCGIVKLTKEAESNICVGDYYPGFVKDMPSRLKATGRLNTDIWKILDEIALSGTLR